MIFPARWPKLAWPKNHWHTRNPDGFNVWTILCFIDVFTAWRALETQRLKCSLRAYIKTKVVEHYSSALSLRACITNSDQMQYYSKPWAFRWVISSGFQSIYMTLLCSPFIAISLYQTETLFTFFSVVWFSKWIFSSLQIQALSKISAVHLSDERIKNTELSAQTCSVFSMSSELDVVGSLKRKSTTFLPSAPFVQYSIYSCEDRINYMAKTSSLMTVQNQSNWRNCS